VEGTVILTAGAMIAAGLATVALAVWTWLAWRNGRPSPLNWMRFNDLPRTQVSNVAMGFDFFFEMITGLAFLVVGLVIVLV
jgi:hypothetical protein